MFLWSKNIPSTPTANFWGPQQVKPPVGKRLLKHFLISKLIQGPGGSSKLSGMKKSRS